MRIKRPKLLSAVVLLMLAASGMAVEGQVKKSDLFLEAVKNKDRGVVKQLLLDGVDVDTRDSRGRTALLIATHHDLPEMAEILISAGANVNARDDINDTAYLYAGAEGRLEILRMTIEAGADLKSVNRYGGTALIPAAHHGEVETVKYLLTTQIDIDYINYLGWTALLEAVILGDGGKKYQLIVDMLLNAGADGNITDKDGETPLDHARRSGYIEIVHLLDNFNSGKYKNEKKE